MTDQPQSMLPVFEAAIIEAIARQFFQPVPTGVDPSGVLMYGNTPMQNLAMSFWSSYKQHILAEIVPKLKVEEIAEVIASQIYKKLTTEPNRYGYDSDDVTRLREQIQKRTIELVAEKRAAQIIEQMAAEEENRRG
jgi:hypothetical protein